MNLRILKKSRKKPRAGDIFTFSIDVNRYFFGRVVSTDAKIGPMEGCILLYLYRQSSESKDDIPADLNPYELLVPPLMTNKQPWLRGYFETVDHLPLKENELLPRHCFRDFTGRYYDEANHEVDPLAEKQCNEYGLHSYRTIDDQVSKALGIPLAED